MARAMPDNDSSGFLSHHVEPVQHVLRLGVEVQGQLPHVVSAVGQEGHPLVHLHALRLEHREQTPHGLGIVGLDEAEALRRPVRRLALAGDHLEAAVRAGGLRRRVDIASSRSGGSAAVDEAQRGASR